MVSVTECEGAEIWGKTCGCSLGRRVKGGTKAGCGNAHSRGPAWPLGYLFTWPNKNNSPPGCFCKFSFTWRKFYCFLLSLNTELFLPPRSGFFINLFFKVFDLLYPTCPPPPPPLVNTILLSASEFVFVCFVSSFVTFFVLYPTRVKSYGVYPFPSDLFHWVWHPQDPSTLSQMSKLYPLDGWVSIPSYICATSSSSSRLWGARWAVLTKVSFIFSSPLPSKKSKCTRTKHTLK